MSLATQHPSEPTRDRHDEIQRIEQLFAGTERLQNDPERFSDLLTDDVVLVNVAGTRLTGRERVRQAMEAALRTPLADIVTRHEVLDIGFLRPDVALVSGIKRVLAGDVERFRAALTLVLVRDGEEWRIAVIQSTPIREAGAPSGHGPTGDHATEGGDALSTARAVPLPGGVGLLPQSHRRVGE